METQTAEFGSQNLCSPEFFPLSRRKNERSGSPTGAVARDQTLVFDWPAGFHGNEAIDAIRYWAVLSWGNYRKGCRYLFPRLGKEISVIFCRTLEQSFELDRLCV